MIENHMIQKDDRPSEDVLREELMFLRLKINKTAFLVEAIGNYIEFAEETGDLSGRLAQLYDDYSSKLYELENAEDDLLTELRLRGFSDET